MGGLRYLLGMTRFMAVVGLVCALALGACAGDGVGEGSGASTTARVSSSDGEATTIADGNTTTVADEPRSDSELPIAACGLVTDEQVQSYLTVDVVGDPGPLSSAGNPLVDDCMWQNPDTFENFSLQYFGGRDLDALDFEGLFEVKDYDGVGDEAITLTDDTGRFNSLWVVTGSYIVVCYPDQFADVPVVPDGQSWDKFFSLCEQAVANADG